MTAWFASLLALALSFAGMAALAFDKERHYEQLTGTHELPPALAAQLRCLGFALTPFAALPCVWAWGSAVGCVAWLGFLAAGALASAAAISAAPRQAARAAFALGLAAVIALAWAGLR